ncbi:MAG: glycosyltransferase, partial [Chitinophagales bacterium]|nr:glycosyltransferase [Chitinophagales bacterium]
MSTVTEDIELSVVVLCYHSENIIEKFVEQLILELTELNVIYELVLVANYDKNSVDNTPVLAAQLAQKYNSIKVLAHEKEGGMGWDMRSGLSAA